MQGAKMSNNSCVSVSSISSRGFPGGSGIVVAV